MNECIWTEMESVSIKERHSRQTNQQNNCDNKLPIQRLTFDIDQGLSRS